MLESHVQETVARLTSALLSIKPLIEGLGAPVRVVPVAQGSDEVPEAWSTGQWNALDEAEPGCRAGRGRRHQFGPAVLRYLDLQVFERVVSGRLALASMSGTVLAEPPSPAEVDRISTAAVANGFDRFFAKTTIIASDGTPVNVYSAGSGSETVVVVPACGMPAALAESWMRFLARGRRVLAAWESRGLFGAAGLDEDYAIDLAAQAGDLFTVLDHFGLADAHVVGLCGGAVIALAAAAAQPDRLCSLSLWHGAYAFASGCPIM